MYQKVPSDMNFVAREKEVSRFWEAHDIMHKSFRQHKGKERYTFYEGPPTANGRPHFGHVITRAMKDLFPRYHTMKGKDVFRIGGWDTHGLPVELEVEKKLGIDGKDQIEAYGIEPFIHECKLSVWKYLKDWEEMSRRVGFWVDMDKAYVTYYDSYIESVWWSLKQVADKGLLYKGHKVVPYCPRCGTALSSHEVAQGYQEVADFSAFVRFPLVDEPDTYLLAWTTTPWTLPSNVALCVNEKEDYVRLKVGEDTLIMAKALVGSLFDLAGEDRPSLSAPFKGSQLLGLKYKPLWPLADTREEALYVVGDSYVSLEDGTGIVHIAPAFGEDDARIGRERGLPFVQLVDTQGRFVADTPWAGTFIKEADPLILEDLAGRGLLQKKALYTHNYPHCWRCDTPLMYYARATWFIRMTQVKDELVRNNRSINWVPENIKEGRMGNFVENVMDWALSRERYWGTPLPVWLCEDDHMHVVGSREELERMSVAPLDDLSELHRPYIDRVVLKCPECGKDMHRTREVIDCWYDSGAMPFAQWHYPFENGQAFHERFPADFISEAVDQTRGWFYSLLAISTLVFGQSSYKNCLVLGHVQDKDGHKMSKHLGNVVDPMAVIERFGADAVRWYFYTAGAPWLPSRYSDEAVSEAQRKYMSTLWNTYAFYILYAQIDRFVPSEHPMDRGQLTLMDRWILSRLHSTIKLVDEHLAAYRVPESANAIASLVDDLSNWYVRRGRARYWGKGMAQDKQAAFITLYTVLEAITRMSAPFTPFLSESIYQNLVRSVDSQAPESVHLCAFPQADESFIDPDMERQMAQLLQVVQLGRACRNQANLKIRQPLSCQLVMGADLGEEYQALAQDELNVKEIIFTQDPDAFTGYRLKPQLRTLGPRFGKRLGAVSKLLAQADGAKAVAAFRRGEALQLQLDGETIELGEDDVLVETTEKEGLVAQEARGVTVGLLTGLTPELIDEGYAREVISKLQTMRRDAGFDVTDRIQVRYTADEELARALAVHQMMVAQVVLATSFEPGPALPGAYSQEWDINGKPATLSILKD
ncbi:MAG: isoleucine--tRNA ligase [Clostridiales bacterium]|nr:isoleucine--tRNA ligase [Clostridiales bacterium]